MNPRKTARQERALDRRRNELAYLSTDSDPYGLRHDLGNTLAEKVIDRKIIAAQKDIKALEHKLPFA